MKEMNSYIRNKLRQKTVLSHVDLSGKVSRLVSKGLPLSIIYTVI
jgi:hypothetical protein